MACFAKPCNPHLLLLHPPLLPPSPLRLCAPADNRNELPENHRALEICDRVKGVLGPDAECTISSAPPDSVCPATSATAVLRRRACKDATSSASLRRCGGAHLLFVGAGHSSCCRHWLLALAGRCMCPRPLFRLVNASMASGCTHAHAFVASFAACLSCPCSVVSRKKLSSSSRLISASSAAASASSLASGGSDAATALKDSYAERQTEVEVSVDNETSPSYSMLTLRCQDRKGLLYDLFRSLKDIDFRWGPRAARSARRPPPAAPPSRPAS